MGRYVLLPTAVISNSDAYKNMNVLSYRSGRQESVGRVDRLEDCRRESEFVFLLYAK